ncbi:MULTISPECIES: AbrB/MazE/SpoVT family DNA-binding domain-containing protein [Paenibacillus]|uniref:AbrB/MazE/SpoVT family DNA-binding domain-containing protein n=1 Tax=Paenibacillus TaxID=44249 RepID=UPI0029E7E92F|nr:AbrB/MazE/SpoVT family DNA-binding domain-containing protein [Paenibacillus caseinilyticus]
MKRVITVKVQKWGNSLGVRIPVAYAEQLNITYGSEVDLLLMKREMVIRPKRQKPALEELLAGITDDNRHHKVDFGKPEGNEIWGVSVVSQIAVIW